MNRIPASAILGLLLTAATSAFADDTDDIAQATQAWAAAMTAHDVERVYALYSPDAVLWGTRSATLRTTPDKVREYFAVLKTVPPSYQAMLDDMHIRVFGDMAVNTGSYTFSQIDQGRNVQRPARFSFVYRKEGGKWLIVDHHSSAVPSATVR